MKKAAFYTLGCKVNQYETEAVSGILASYNYEIVDFDSFADVYIINTCTVTGLADRKCRQVIRKAKRLNPGAIVAAMGCYSQAAPLEVAKLDDVDIIIGTDMRKNLPQIIQAYETDSSACKKPVIRVGDIRDTRKFEELGIETYTGHTRAFLKIQDGCNRYCSYCIIPYVRGPVRSKEPDKVVSDINNLVLKGYKEFVLTGIHLASYGLDLKNIDLVDILSRVCEIEGVKRIRLGSIEPMTITDKFIDFVKNNPKICPHFHISLQSGSNSVLKRMNRKYTAEEYYKRCTALRGCINDMAVTTDIIAGFPGETEKEFEETMRFAEKVDFSKIHVFKYSPRKGTPAAAMPEQITSDIKEKRSQRLIELSDRMGKRFAEAMIGKRVNVLIEKNISDGSYEGHSENYLRVIFGIKNREETSENICGEIKTVLITGSEGDCLYGIFDSQL